MSTVNEKMTAIGDAIRSKTEGTDTLTRDEMAEAISGIETGSGAATAGEWFCAASLPTTFVQPPPGTGTTYYYEVPANCKAILVKLGIIYKVSYKTAQGNFTADEFSGALSISDADNTGTILSILDYGAIINSCYILPIYQLP